MFNEFADVQYFTNFVWPGIVYVVIVCGTLLAAWSVSHILRTSRIPAVTMDWLFIIISVPLIGVPLYFTFGLRKLNSRINLKSKMHLPGKSGVHRHPVNSLLVSLGIPASSEGNFVNFHKDGKAAYDELMVLLDDAVEIIDIAIFILGDDTVGRAVLSLLEKKAAMGVRVRLLLDGVGSFMLPKNNLSRLEKNGGQVAWFIPVVHCPCRAHLNAGFGALHPRHTSLSCK